MHLTLVRFRVADEARARAAADRLYAELMPTARGWLGAVGGTTPDGERAVVGLWESDEAQRRNGERPEQQAWWAEFNATLAGEPRFEHFPDAYLPVGPLPASAGFGQVLLGRTNDAPRAVALMEEVMPALRRHRPEISAIAIGVQPDGAFAELVLFSDEQSARAGEVKPPPEEFEQWQEEMGSLMPDPPTFVDLREPDVFLPPGR